MTGVGVGQVGVTEAARQLGVSERVLRRRLARGDVRGETVAGRWVLDEQALEHALQHRAPAGRPLAPTTAWALLSALTRVDDVVGNGQASGSDPDGSDGARRFRGALPDRRLRHRLIAFLRSQRADERLAAALRRRGQPSRYWAHPGVLPAVLRDGRVVLGGAHALAAVGADLSPAGRFRVYVRAGDLADLVARYHLEPDPAGDLEVLAIPTDVPEHHAPTHGGPPPVAAALVDLLEEHDARGRALAQQWLQALIDSAVQPDNASGSSVPARDQAGTP